MNVVVSLATPIIKHSLSRPQEPPKSNVPRADRAWVIRRNAHPDKTPAGATTPVGRDPWSTYKKTSHSGSLTRCMMAEEEGFDPVRTQSVKKTRQWRVFSAARSAQADRINFELRSKFRHPSSSTHTPITFNPNPTSQTCTSPSKDVKKCRFWRVVYTFVYDTRRA